MAKSDTPADPRAAGREARAALDRAVATAQREEGAAGKAETQAQRDARVKRDREAREELNAAVEAAQLEAGHGARLNAEAETPAERAARIKAGHDAVKARQAAVEAAIDRENRILRGEDPDAG